jgi:hypothetical protein
LPLSGASFDSGEAGDGSSVGGTTASGPVGAFFGAFVLPPAGGSVGTAGADLGGFTGFAG